MKFALVSGDRTEAARGLIGKCVFCGTDVLARCGEIRVAHWAHKARRICDPWWEHETEWHRNWKNQFPVDWQEVVHTAEDGERHVADIRTPAGRILEFQHSHLDQFERRSREAFYPDLIWIIDGARRKRDQGQFNRVITEQVDRRTNFNENSLSIRKVTFPEGALFRDWLSSPCHVIFDFGDDMLWWMLPQSNDITGYLCPLQRADFVLMHRQADPGKPDLWGDLAFRCSEIIGVG